MNLQDLTNYVTTKSQLIEPDDVTACQLFLSKRYELIYNSYLWKDALTMVNVPVNPVTNADNAVGIVFLPEQIDRLVAIRTNDSSVRIQGLEHFYRIDWDAFCAAGVANSGFCPTEMAILSPIWKSVRPVSAPPASLIPVDATFDDNANYLVLNLMVGASYYLTTAVFDSAQDTIQIGNYSDGVFTPTGGVVPTNGISLQFTASGNALSYTAPSQGGDNFVNANLVKFAFTPNRSVPGSIINVSSNNQADQTGPQAVQVKVTWRDSTDTYTITTGLPFNLTPPDGLGFIEIESIFKPLTQGVFQIVLENFLINQFGNLTNQTTIGTMAAASLKTPSYQRVRIFPIPTAPTTLNVLGKKPFIPLTFPTEVPAIRNLDNCLIAFAMGDMLERARQFGKAQAQYQEAAALLSELAKIETIQAANNTQFVPEGGYGDCFFAPGRYGFYGGAY